MELGRSFVCRQFRSGSFRPIGMPCIGPAIADRRKISVSAALAWRSASSLSDQNETMNTRVNGLDAMEESGWSMPPATIAGFSTAGAAFGDGQVAEVIRHARFYLRRKALAGSSLRFKILAQPAGRCFKSCDHDAKRLQTARAGA